jgi:hypothetical protein
VEGVYYLVFLVAVGVIIHWYITNDRVGSNQPTRGILAMAEERRQRQPNGRRPNGRR